MSPASDRSTRPSRRPIPPPSLPTHVFTAEFLAWLAERDEPETAGQADTAGPWHVEAGLQSGWAVLREGESLEKGSAPMAVLERKEAAQLAAAILPGTGRRLRYRLSPDADDRGYPLLLDGRPVGHCLFFHEDFVAALNVVDALMTAPREFAFLLDAMGGLALEHVDRIAVARLAEAG
jgi:hypothetical protein